MMELGGIRAILRLSKSCILVGFVTIAVVVGGASCGGNSAETGSSPNPAEESARPATAQDLVAPGPSIVAEPSMAQASQGSTAAAPQAPQTSTSRAIETEGAVAITVESGEPAPTSLPANSGTSSSKATSGPEATPAAALSSTSQVAEQVPAEVPQETSTETGEESKVSSANVPEPGHSALSTGDLRSVPKGDYPWVVMVDPDTFIAGDVPSLVGNVIGIPHIPSLLADVAGVPVEEMQGTISLLDGYDISADAVEKVTVLGGNFGDNGPLEFALALEGNFDHDAILNILNNSGYWLRVKGSGLWFYESEVYGVAAFEDEGYLIVGDPDDVGAAFGELSRSANRSDVTWAGEIGISTSAIEIAAIVSDDDRPRSNRVVALRGDFDFAQVRNQLSVNGYSVDPRNEEGYEVWQQPDNVIVIALVEYNDYVLLGDRYLISKLFHPDFSPLIPGRILRQVYGMKLGEVDTLVSLGGGTAILGNYDLEEFRAAMQGNEQVENSPFEAWILTDPLTSESLYAELFEDAIYTFPVSILADTDAGVDLRDDPGNPLIEAMDRAGTGWLLGAWSGPWYCKKFAFDIDVDSCQATALAARSADDGAVAVNWVILMDGPEAAAKASVQLENALAAKEALLSVASVLSLGRTEEGLLEYEVTSEGSSVLVEVTVTSEYAASFLYLVLSELENAMG